MLANGAKETTTTTGTGTVTLSAVTGFPRFSDILGVGTLVDYAIRSGDAWEWGIGTLGAGNTLERSIISAKYESGVYSKNPASGVSLSGTSEVFCTAHSATIAPAAPAMPQRGSLIRHIYSAAAEYRMRTTGAASASALYMFPYYVGLRCRVTKIGVSAAGSVAGATCRAGLYAMKSDGAPGALLFESGLLTAETANTDYFGTITEHDLLPGWYWGCLHIGGTAPNLFWFSAGDAPHSLLGLLSPGLPSRAVQYWFRSQTLAALPADASTFGSMQIGTKGNDPKHPMIVLEVA